MEAVKPSYQIMTPLDTSAQRLNILMNLEDAGRVCYKSEHKNPNGDLDITIPFLEGIIRKGHESVLEHEKLTIKFVVDRGVSHELVRHRICSFSQESTRYCNYGKKGMQFILPPWADEYWLGELTESKLSDAKEGEMGGNMTDKGIADMKWAFAVVAAGEYYLRLLELGQSPQQARAVLPNSLKTEIVVTANIRQWREVFRQRCHGTAHPQMREIMRPLYCELRNRLPVLFSDLFNDSWVDDEWNQL